MSEQDEQLNWTDTSFYFINYLFLYIENTSCNPTDAHFTFTSADNITLLRSVCKCSRIFPAPHFSSHIMTSFCLGEAKVIRKRQQILLDYLATALKSLLSSPRGFAFSQAASVNKNAVMMTWVQTDGKCKSHYAAALDEKSS